METFLNSDILKLLVVLLTLVAIVFMFLKFRKNDDNKKIHIYYISGLCVFIILELITYICVKNNNSTDIVKYISFASTLSSLLLSVVAIIYAIVSNNKGDAQYQKIDRASDRISESVDRFSRLSDGLSDSINSILGKLDEIKTISNETQKAISNNSQPNTSISTGNTNKINLKEFYENYITFGSYSGNLALLACCYSYEKKKPFLTLDVFGTNSAYSYGYIIASTVSGIITIQTLNDVVYVNSINLANLKDLLIKQINAYIEKSIPENKSYNVTVYDNVKRFFEIND